MVGLLKYLSMGKCYRDEKSDLIQLPAKKTLIKFAGDIITKIFPADSCPSTAKAGSTAVTRKPVDPTLTQVDLTSVDATPDVVRGKWPILDHILHFGV